MEHCQLTMPGPVMRLDAPIAGTVSGTHQAMSSCMWMRGRCHVRGNAPGFDKLLVGVRAHSS